MNKYKGILMEDNNNNNNKWYTLQVHSGSEFAVKKQIEALIYNGESFDGGTISRILVPSEEVIEYKKGIEVIKLVPIYKAYAFIECSLTTGLQMKIQNIPKVGKFVSEGRNPVHISEEDINKILSHNQENKAPRLKVDFEEGSEIRIIEGSMANFIGTVKSFNPQTGELHLGVNILGRDTPVEIHYSKVALSN
jgi:transcriptional antiterminator NusG